MEEIKSSNEIQLKQLNQLSRKELTSLLDEMDKEVKKAHRTVNELKASRETLEQCDYKTLKHLEQCINADIKSADEARKTFKKKWEAPLKEVESAFNAELTELRNIHAEYKAERVRRDEALKQNTYNALYESYIELLEDNALTELGELIPFERIFDPKWTNKSFGELKAIGAMTDKVIKILNDYKTLLSIQLKCPEETRARFIECLDLNKSIEFDTLRAIQKEQEQKLKERVKPIQIEEERIPTEPEEVPPVQEQQIPWVLVIDSATPTTIKKIKNVLKEYGLSGVFMPGTIEQAYSRVRGDKHE